MNLIHDIRKKMELKSLFEHCKNKETGFIHVEELHRFITEVQHEEASLEDCALLIQQILEKKAAFR